MQLLLDDVAFMHAYSAVRVLFDASLIEFQLLLSAQQNESNWNIIMSGG